MLPRKSDIELTIAVDNITMYDYLRVPDVLPGEYVLGFRWDCESSAQVWQACADVTITK
eukprot:SAG31_NODE_169_length_21415_cov_29.765338_5_plen_59_part_00